MDKKLLSKLADVIFESEEKMTFPKILEVLQKEGIPTEGTEDFVSEQLKNCIYWRNMSPESIEVLRDLNRFYNVTLQPYGFDQEGVKFYKESYPDSDIAIFNHLVMDKMHPKSQKKFMAKPYLMPVYWVPISKAVYIKRS